MKIPGPDHPITITPATTRWRAMFHGHLLADTGGAMLLREASYPQVVYFPREDVAMDFLSRTDHTTHCPYKGDASYYTIYRDGEVAENAVWSYEHPYPAMAAIQDLVAFYPDRVDIEAVDAPADSANREAVDETILHTDSGSGRPQREPWPPNVDGPEGGVR
jgi:uncharacterized protein (DUF427 family)